MKITQIIPSVKSWKLICLKSQGPNVITSSVSPQNQGPWTWITLQLWQDWHCDTTWITPALNYNVTADKHRPIVHCVQTSIISVNVRERIGISWILRAAKVINWRWTDNSNLPQQSNLNLIIPKLGRSNLSNNSNLASNIGSANWTSLKVLIEHLDWL